MNSIDIRIDLEKRKEQITSVSAYTSLRKGIKFLCTVYIILVIITLSFELITFFKNLNSGVSILTSLTTILFSALSVFIAIIIRNFLFAILDAIDLQLLSNRRNELERKKEAN